MVGWTFRPEHDAHRNTPFREPPAAMSQSRARRAFYIALARSRSDMLAVAQDVWDRMVAIAESTSEAGVADDTAKRTALSLLQTLARGEFDRDRISKLEMEQFIAAIDKIAEQTPSYKPTERKAAAARSARRKALRAGAGASTAYARYAAEMASAPLGPDGRIANKALLPEEIRRLLRQGRPSIGFFEGRGDAKDQLVWDALHGFRPTPRPDPSQPGALDGLRPPVSLEARSRQVVTRAAWGAGPGEGGAPQSSLAWRSRAADDDATKAIESLRRTKSAGATSKKTSVVPV